MRRLLLVLLLALPVTVLIAPAGAVVTVPTPTAQGVWPLQPRPAVVRGFDPPRTAYGRGHRGVDLRGHTGQSVHAALGGTVSFAGTLAGRGVVVVDHGASSTTYEPVSATVEAGQSVGRGEPIGTLQRAGSHCFPGACLHWGLYRGGGRDKVYLDPLVLVGAGPVRLLPLDAGPSAGAAQARGWASRYAARSRSLDTWV